MATEDDLRSVQAMKAQLVLCDWAEVVGGKLYLQGGGWATIAAAAATQTAVAVLIDIPYTQTNRQHDGVMALYNQDNQPYPPQQPFRIEFQLEAGRPPGMLVWAKPDGLRGIQVE